MAFRGTYQQCPGCPTVIIQEQLADHHHKCTGKLSIPSGKKLKGTGRSKEYVEARARFLTKLAENHGKNPFDILCRQCPPDCDFNLPTSGIPVEDYLKEWDLHYEALDPVAAEKVRLMHRKTAALEERLQEQNRVAAIRTQEADQKLEAAKVMEQNSHELISEQLAVNDPAASIGAMSRSPTHTTLHAVPQLTEVGVTSPQALPMLLGGLCQKDGGPGALPAKRSRRS